ncbi:MAG TPA: alcohol dehydrogenase catalytic domain-containing protein [Alphaproteobacteria bacterium]
MKTMITARMHEIGAPLRLDTLPIPVPGPTDVLVAVKACNIVPNLRNILKHWPQWFPDKPLPKLPASFGLDAAGVIAEVGSQVFAVKPGERVYVNPARSCGSCRACRGGDPISCRSFTYQGYFGRGPLGRKILDAYPYGGLSEYLTAPQSALVKLPDNVPFEAAARFGYLGTAYSAMRKTGVGPGRTVLINGIGGTLGLCGALVGLAMGATKILGTGRRQPLLERVKALAPDRIEVLAVGGQPIRDWALTHTDGDGVDAVIDALSPQSPPSAMMDGFRALRVGGRGADPGGVSAALTLDASFLRDYNAQLMGSRWFTTAEGDDLAAMAGAGTLDLSHFEHRRFPLAKVNDAIAALGDGDGGFTNFVVLP